MATIFAVPPGPWRWVTDGTAPHLIGAGRANRRTGNYAAIRFKKGRRKVLLIGGRPITGPVAHPGTAGKGAWDAVRRGRDILVPKVFRRELRKAIHG
jgi:hypothetical protein